MRAIIIGSGIAGLTAALALQRVGISSTIYERAQELTEVGAGISLWANAFRALDYIGVGKGVRDASLPVHISEFRVREGSTVAASFSATRFEHQLGMAPFIAMIHRAELVATLASHLPTGTARYGFECLDIKTCGAQVFVRFKNGHTDQADLVIGADGIRSVVRSKLFRQIKLRYAGYTCWRGICPRPSSLAPGHLAEWWGRGQRFGITTLPANRVYWWATKNEPANERFDDERSGVLAAFCKWVEPVPGLIASTAPANIIRNDIYDRLPTSQWVSGRVVLIGDAAHPITPNFGQGGGMAIEDAAALARHLKGSTNPEPGLASFVAERHPRTAAIALDSWRFGRIGQWEGRTSCWLRDMVFSKLLPSIGPRSLPKYAAHDIGSL